MSQMIDLVISIGCQNQATTHQDFVKMGMQWSVVHRTRCVDETRQASALISWTAPCSAPLQARSPKPEARSPKPEARTSEHFATHSLAGASGLYSQWLSWTCRCPVRERQCNPALIELHGNYHDKGREGLRRAAFPVALSCGSQGHTSSRIDSRRRTRICD